MAASYCDLAISMYPVHTGFNDCIYCRMFYEYNRDSTLLDTTCFSRVTLQSSRVGHRYTIKKSKENNGNKNSLYLIEGLLYERTSSENTKHAFRRKDLC
jgi:hypothetical protein